MDVRLRGFGSIEVDGLEYEHDIVIDGGEVRKRKKKPSKPYRDEFGHTPLSGEEELPWAGSRLIPLHGLQMIRQLAGVVVPPCARATMWSRCAVLSSTLPQSGHG